MIAKVAIENTSFSFDKLYSYIIPLEMRVCEGVRVTVPFGGANRVRQGLVMIIEDDEENMSHIKQITSVIDKSPIFTAEMLMLVHHLKESTFCTYYDAVGVIIPAGIGMNLSYVYSLNIVDELPVLSKKENNIVSYILERKKHIPDAKLYKDLLIDQSDFTLIELIKRGIIIKEQRVKRKILDDKITMVRIGENFDSQDLTPKQNEVIRFLRSDQIFSLKELCYYAGVTKAVTDTLCRKGYIEYYQREVYRNPYADKEMGTPDPFVLTEEQQRAYEKLKQMSSGCALLFGVTGSGKTQVFLSLTKDVLENGKKVIIMVPEIALTPQTIDKFHRQFGKRVAVIHSGLSLGERLDEWKRIKNNDADIVVGTRSAVFAPLDSIGLIVIDEEQESSYKSDRSPRFHARDIAKYRTKYHNALLVLSSATPTIESFYLAQKGVYQMVSINNRYAGKGLPYVNIVDMKDISLKTSTSLSSVLTEEIYYNLKHCEQTILLLNRRGYNTMVRCSSCGKVAECPNCSISLTFHSINNCLICHYCGFIRPLITECENCKEPIGRYQGIGTQKLEEELHSLYPQARILRMDMDTTMSKLAYEKGFNGFLGGEYDIMVGTQMVAKGHDFPNVTLVGIINADEALYVDDFRSFERAFGIITQVVGRCGRGDKPGRAFIQTFTPENPTIALAATQNYPKFYEDEIKGRKLYLYPPFCTLAGIMISGKDQDIVKNAAQIFVNNFIELAKNEYPSVPIRILGPSEHSVLKALGKYRYRIIIKCRNDLDFRNLLRCSVQEFTPKSKAVSLSIDMYFDGN